MVNRKDFPSTLHVKIEEDGNDVKSFWAEKHYTDLDVSNDELFGVYVLQDVKRVEIRVETFSQIN